MEPWYCTREDVMQALDVDLSARAVAQVDRACSTASRLVEQPDALNRHFYPRAETVTLDWPPAGPTAPWRLWLDRRAQLIELTAATSGGRTLALADLKLYPADGPPYAYLEVDRSTDAYWGGGDTDQQAIALTGVWGYRLDELTAGTLAAAAGIGDSTMDITASTTVGVGSLLRVDDERLLVTGRRMLDTGQTLTAPLGDERSDTTVQVSDGAAFEPGETILVDGERLAVDDIAGSTLIVRRSEAGTVLAAHTSGAAVWAPRRLQVLRGQLGTTAAAHSSGAAVAVHEYPGPVRDLALAEAIVQLGREHSGYARVIGAGEAVRGAPGGDLRDVRAHARARYRRSIRTLAV